jgi:peptidoglycan hydrolase-like protein with peptidoglycan-binding domain
MRKILAILAAAVICLAPLSSLAAYQSTTLRNGMRGEEVAEIQRALITLGYLKGTADGVFGNNTENAVRKFQRKNKLTADGLVGTKTKELLLAKASGSSAPTESTPSSSGNDSATASGSNASAAQGSGNTSSGASLFGGNYATIKSGSRGARVRTLQNALIALNYLSGSADGSYGKKTKAAVVAFQQANSLTADGAAGKKTLAALEKAYRNGEKASSPASDPAPAATPAPEQEAADSGSINPKISAPGSVQLLSWYDVVKPALSGGSHLLVYDPSSGLSWTLRVLARGRHCDAEPLTAQDTRTMVKAFGGTNTWNQKGVYVQLPDGRWSVASTHDMPHDNGTIKDNDFNGHLCVHFLRTMEEAKQNDPKYGVANQETIRKLWKSLTGQDVPE